MLGSTGGLVNSWSDTQVVATVASTSLTGVVRIQQSGVWSNAVGFTVPSSNGVTLVPNLLNMVVDDTRTIQALSPAGQPVTGLTWTSSNTAVVGLSSDDPPVLTALAAGHVTITAGTASSDITVSAAALPLGTVVWSNPGNGSSVLSILPAVPSPTGVADVFAVEGYYIPQPTTVQAITSDGTTAWTASFPSLATLLPDFQGGLVVYDGFGLGSIKKLDGITGQPYPAYTSGSTGSVITESSLVVAGPVAVHTDGTIFAIQESLDTGTSVIGIDPITGAKKFSVPLEEQPYFSPYHLPFTCGSARFFSRAHVSNIIVAGDGYAYVGYDYPEYNIMCSAGNSIGSSFITHLRLLRVNSAGAFNTITIRDAIAPTPTGLLPQEEDVKINMITNADTGILLAWSLNWGGDSFNPPPTQFGMAITTGTSLSDIGGPAVPGQFSAVVPGLQVQDGSFAGSVAVGTGQQINMIAFDASGNLRWSVPNEQPQIATQDGGVIGKSGITYDQNGSSTGRVNMATQSWTGNMYQFGSVEQVAVPPILTALTLWAQIGGGPSVNNTASRTWFFRLSFQNDFTFTPVFPNVLNNLTTDITYSATLIKQAALKAARHAFEGSHLPVTVFEGDRGGDRLTIVPNNDDESPPGCGATNYNNLLTQVGYLRNMEEAQDALQLVINNAQDESAALARPDTIRAIGRGIGNVAAHEIAHTFLGLCCTMQADPTSDVNARGTFNAEGCNGRTDPSPWTGFWPTPRIPLHWEQPALDALRQCLGGGWRNFGQSCHN